MTTLQKQVKDGDKPTHPVDSEVEKILCDMLKGIPKQVASSGNSVLFKQTRFPCFFLTGIVKKKSKTIYTIENLIQCGMQVTDCFYGLLNVANTDQLPTDNAMHLLFCILYHPRLLVCT